MGETGKSMGTTTDPRVMSQWEREVRTITLIAGTEGEGEVAIPPWSRRTTPESPGAFGGCRALPEVRGKEEGAREADAARPPARLEYVHLCLQGFASHERRAFTSVGWRVEPPKSHAPETPESPPRSSSTTPPPCPVANARTQPSLPTAFLVAVCRTRSRHAVVASQADVAGVAECRLHHSFGPELASSSPRCCSASQPPLHARACFPEDERSLPVAANELQPRSRRLSGRRCRRWVPATRQRTLARVDISERGSTIFDRT